MVNLYARSSFNPFSSELCFYFEIYYCAHRKKIGVYRKNKCKKKKTYLKLVLFDFYNIPFAI